MDVQIRQTKMPSFQDSDQAIRQTALRGMSSASVLREEVLSELPDQYRRVLYSMSPREQEKLLSKVETSVNRRIASGAISKTVARLDEREREEIQRIASGESRDVRRQIIADKYRLPEMRPRAGPGDVLKSVSANSPQMRRYLEGASRQQTSGHAAAEGMESGTEPAGLAGDLPTGESCVSGPQTGHHGFMRTMDSHPCRADSISYAEQNLPGESSERMKALQAAYLRQHPSDWKGSLIPDRETSAVPADDFDENPVQFSERQSNVVSNQYSSSSGSGNRRTADFAVPGKTGDSGEPADAKQAATVMSDEVRKELQKEAMKAEAVKTKAKRTRKASKTLTSRAEGKRTTESMSSDMDTALSRYQQLLNTAGSSQDQKQIQDAMQKAIEGTAGKKEQAVLRKASQKAAFASRKTSDAYRTMLTVSGLQTDGQKAAVQMAYEKQIRKRIKAEYRKELIGKLSKQKTQSLMKKAEEKKYQRNQEAASETNQAMTDQMRSAAGVMSAGAKALRRIAEDAAKAVKTLVQKKLILFIIPVILVAAIPIVMTALPLISVISESSYEDNEVYAYADAAELIAYAQQWIGKIPYVWGGGHGGSATAWQSGCDCSGFVHGVFNHFGYEIGGDTGAMETQAGTHIAYDSLANAKPGDVIIYYRTAAHVKGDPNGSGSTHVSIYEGNNRIIHQAGGVHESTEYHQYFEVRRVLTADVAGRGNISGGLGGMGTYGHRTDNTNYSTSDLQLIWAIIAQEDNGSYKGALAVISTAMNRVESPQWSYEGSNALAQLTAPGQFCYSNDHYWEARLGGNVPDYVKQAVNDCLKKGKRNHSHTSFRSTKGKVTGDDAVQIGGNWYFG